MHANCFKTSFVADICRRPQSQFLETEGFLARQTSRHDLRHRLSPRQPESQVRQGRERAREIALAAVAGSILGQSQRSSHSGTQRLCDRDRALPRWRSVILDTAFLDSSLGGLQRALRRPSQNCHNCTHCTHYTHCTHGWLGPPRFQRHLILDYSSSNSPRRAGHQPLKLRLVPCHRCFDLILGFRSVDLGRRLPCGTNARVVNIALRTSRLKLRVLGPNNTGRSFHDTCFGLTREHNSSTTHTRNSSGLENQTRNRCKAHS